MSEMEIFLDREGREIRLTSERQAHTLQHPEMEGQIERVKETLEHPDLIVLTEADETVLVY
jgi:hypothetical protein